MSQLGIVILAAGKGTRMKSDLPKVLHTINNKSMLSCVLETASKIADNKIVVVVGHQAEKVKQKIGSRFKVAFAIQQNLLGTGDAVKAALPLLPDDVKTVLVLCGDVPLIRERTLADFVKKHDRMDNDLTVLAVKLDNPTGYGRIILDGNEGLVCIKEEADASETEKTISLINAGIYCISKAFLFTALDLIDSNNAQKEYYLTDIVGIAREKRARIGYVTGQNPKEIMGVNTLDELKTAQAIFSEME